MIRGRLPLAVSLFLVLTSAAGAQTENAPTVYSFAGGADGIQPNSLILAADGYLYGTTAYGGNNNLVCPGGSAALPGCGTIFRMNTDGSNETVVYTFTGGTDGGVPTGLVQGPDGNLYGTTAFGGASVSDGKACTDENNMDTNPNQPNVLGKPIYCCPSSDFSKSAGCGTIFRLPFPESISGSDTPVVLKSFHGVVVNGTTSVADYAYPGPMVPGVLADGTTLLFGTAQPCSYCSYLSITSNVNGSGTNGAVVALNPGSTPTVTFLALDSSSDDYPNSVVQGLECPTGATSNSTCQASLYGTTQLGQTQGGVFVYDLSSITTAAKLAAVNNGTSSNAFDLGCDFASNAQNLGNSPATLLQRLPNGGGLSSHAGGNANIIIQQPGSKFPSGQEWGMNTAPVSITEANDGSILGTTPWACFNEGQPNDPAAPTTYSIGSSCGSGTDNATVFQCQPPLPLSNPVTPSSIDSGWTLNTVYAFSDSSSAKDGEGVTNGVGLEASNPASGAAGLLLASDGNYYITSGTSLYELTSSEMNEFLGSASGSAPGPFASLPGYGPEGSNLLAGTPPEPTLIQGPDGTLFGISASAGSNAKGAVYEVTPALAAPMQLTVSPATIVLNSLSPSATLNWSVPNAYSMTARQCFEFVQGGAQGAGKWSGPAVATTFSPTSYSGSATVTPTAAGTYSYALTCGGTTSVFATLQVNNALALANSLSNAAQDVAYSAQLQASGGIPPYTWKQTGLPSWLSLSSAGVLSGTPTAAGSFSFTVTVTDSESKPVSVPASFTLTVLPPPPTVTLTSSAASVAYGQSITLTATANPLASGYSWTINDGTTALVGPGAASNTLTGIMYAPPMLSAGQHTFTAVFSSSNPADATGTSNPLLVTVNKAATTTSVAASTNNANLNTAVTFTATVSSTTTGNPTGQVQFLNGTTPLGTATLSLTTGVATFSANLIQAGTASITAQYLGDGNFLASTSSPAAVVVTAPAAALTAAPNTLTVKAGQSVTTTVTLTPVGGYAGTLTLACPTSSLPPYSSCSFNKPTLTADGSNTALTSTLTFATNVSTQASLERKTPVGSSRSNWMVEAGALAGVLWLGGFRRRKWFLKQLRRSALLVILLGVTVAASLIGCGGSGSSSNTSNTNNGGNTGGTNVTPAGNYTVSVTATATGGTSPQPLSLSISVTP
jgi:hypothetical protein